MDGFVMFVSVPRITWINHTWSYCLFCVCTSYAVHRAPYTVHRMCALFVHVHVHVDIQCTCTCVHVHVYVHVVHVCVCVHVCVRVRVSVRKYFDLSSVMITVLYVCVKLAVWKKACGDNYVEYWKIMLLLYTCIQDFQWQKELSKKVNKEQYLS